MTSDDYKSTNTSYTADMQVMPLLAQQSKNREQIHRSPMTMEDAITR